MKKILIALLLTIFSLSSGYSQNHTFVHPGCPWTLNDLEQMKNNRNVHPWSVGWDLIVNSNEASLNYNMQGPAVDVNRNDNNIINDGNSALYHAFQWYFTGNSAHAEKAISILESWAAVHQTWSGNAVHLHAAWRGGTMVKAAEILRYTYPGWSNQNTATCEEYFLNVYWPQFRLPNPLRAANQGANNLWGAIQVAVFCNDQEKFQQCIDAFLNDPCAGIQNTLPNGQCGDTGRDQGHAGSMVGWLFAVAEIAWAQGVDLYGVLDNRLLNVIEYWAEYNSGQNVPFIDHGTCYDYFTEIGAQNRDPNSRHVVTMMEDAHAAYVIRKGISSPEVLDYRSGIPFNENTFLYRKDAGYNSTASTIVEPDPEFEMTNVTSLISSDIGNPGQSGSSSFNNGTWTVNGSGSDISSNEDEDSFHFAYTEMSGDGAFVARVTSIENTDPNARAVITIRDSLSGDARMAVVGPRPQLGAEFSARGFDAADGSGETSFFRATAPLWIKIERRGDNIAGFIGPDGVTWSPMQNTTFSFGNNYYIGLGVTSHNNNTLCTATFTNVQKSTGFVSTSFTPDPNATYYIDSPQHNRRLAADGNSEDPYTTSTSTTGDDVEWRFVAKGNGSWHVQRAAGGSVPRLRTRNNGGEPDMQATSSSGNRTYYDFDSSNAINGTYHMTLPDGPEGLTRLQINSNFDISFVPPSFSGTWESFRFTEVEGSNIVTIRKRNASGFGLDGGNGAANAQNVYLWNHNPNNVNQQWEEIDRGGGFFSYQKAGTNHSIDGGNGGSTGQNVYIWQTSPTNFNQHWRKVQITGNIYLLQKRNAAGFALDGGKGGATGQNVYMWTTNTGNQNQHWIFE